MLTASSQLKHALPQGVIHNNHQLRLNVNPETYAQPIRKDKEQVVGSTR